MTLKDYIKYKIWKLFNIDTYNFLKLWKTPSAFSSILFGLMIGFALLYSYSKLTLYLVLSWISVLFVLIIELVEDYKNKDWFRWKIERLKQKESIKK